MNPGSNSLEPTVETASTQFGGMPSKQNSKLRLLDHDTVGMTVRPCCCQNQAHHRERKVLNNCNDMGIPV
jgi:hypothetical protein